MLRRQLDGRTTMVRNVGIQFPSPTFRTMTSSTKTDALLSLAKAHPVRAKDLAAAGIPRSYLRRLVDRGLLEQVSRGV